MFMLIVIVIFCAINAVLTQLSDKDILSLDYNRDVAPIVDGEPVAVNVSMVVLSLQPDLNQQMVSMSFIVIYELPFY